MLAKMNNQDEMTHNAAFHQGRHCLMRLKLSLDKEIQFYVDIITVNLQYIQ